MEDKPDSGEDETEAAMPPAACSARAQ